LNLRYNRLLQLFIQHFKTYKLSCSRIQHQLMITKNDHKSAACATQSNSAHAAKNNGAGNAGPPGDF